MHAPAVSRHKASTEALSAVSVDAVRTGRARARDAWLLPRVNALYGVKSTLA